MCQHGTLCGIRLAAAVACALVVSVLGWQAGAAAADDGPVCAPHGNDPAFAIAVRVLTGSRERI